MIRKLRRRFTAMAMCAMVSVTLVLAGAINLLNFWDTGRQIERMLVLIAENDGRIPEPGIRGEDRPPEPPPGGDITPETQFRTRFFWIKTDRQGEITHIETGNIAAVTEAQAAEYARTALERGRAQGRRGIYFYRIFETDSGKMLVFLDCDQQVQSRGRLLSVSLLVGTGCIAVVFLIVLGLSGRAVKPFVQSIEKQRQFITDASHELKTPLTILSANADLLVMEQPGLAENEWLVSIKNQTERLRGLTEGLLLLARFDEMKLGGQVTQLSLSELTGEAAGPFCRLARAQGKTFEMQIRPHIRVAGDPEGLRRLVSALAENAVKHSGEGGRIRLELTRKGRNAVLRVTNTCAPVPPEQMPRLFDRFYRADPARAPGGYGIGLSVAKAVAEAHRGKISTQSEGTDAIIFTVELPLLTD